ncbi:hypothetical protein HA052_06425 [Chromobacterium haemolyticum]|uniref:YqjK-like protein n=1 Tax=Chromobacterium fluminis TaxID=3044269 RepID=A0ABX0L188_9NEIS|nr:hypothetical protein [Chromobacterium haemolyticum]NHR04831.1 hypothetical protein [Chromobacterium haemolyticum]OQS41175.1 hypothetical protein B0T39_09455 [Chromobacterium haemolyticum]
MNPRDRAIKKQLLVMKGEALRVKLRLELGTLRRHPLGVAGEGLKAWSRQRGLGKILATLGSLLPPGGRLQSWLGNGARLWALWQLGRRLWRNR